MLAIEVRIKEKGVLENIFKLGAILDKCGQFCRKREDCATHGRTGTRSRTGRKSNRYRRTPVIRRRILEDGRTPAASDTFQKACGRTAGAATDRSSPDRVDAQSA